MLLDKLVGTKGGKLLDVALEPVALDGFVFRLRFSIGAAMFPDHGSDRDTLINRADAAMYEAKQIGGGYLINEL